MYIVVLMSNYVFWCGLFFRFQNVGIKSFSSCFDFVVLLKKVCCSISEWSRTLVITPKNTNIEWLLSSNILTPTMMRTKFIVPVTNFAALEQRLLRKILHLALTTYRQLFRWWHILGTDFTQNVCKTSVPSAKICSKDAVQAQQNWSQVRWKY